MFALKKFLARIRSLHCDGAQFGRARPASAGDCAPRATFTDVRLASLGLAPELPGRQVPHNGFLRGDRS